MHLNGTLLFKKYALPYFKDNMKVLEIAPFGTPSFYMEIVNNHNIQWFTLDISEKFIGTQNQNPYFILAKEPYRYPIEDQSFDIIISDQVIAHVNLFWVWMQELKRILKKEGHIITIASLSYPACPSPVDCWRIHADGMNALNEFLNLKTLLVKTESLELQYFGYPEKYNKIPNFRVQSESIATTNTKTPKILLVNKIKIFFNSIFYRIPLLRSFLNPVRTAYDTISIAQKNTDN